MSKVVQILLTKELTVNLGKDKDGQQKTVTLPAGLQEVDAEIAEHWFVKAHAQEITASACANKELQVAFDALQIQSDAANLKIKELEQAVQDKDQQIKELQTLLAKAEQTQTGAVKQADTPADAETKTKGK
ncbi:hypothetical protein [Acinetobacter sp.]|jgi:hypothetical protein|uniref:STY1053 family phage-associated protein n=1 Tax=Acinetobacter sp. TaxID=472 RepID=UPI0028263F46|nr:hypothetical protein [Acinetobacter sp.]MDR0238132.1 hypothetical protein [Acinetobacter sp.]